MVTDKKRLARVLMIRIMGAGLLYIFYQTVMTVLNDKLPPAVIFVIGMFDLMILFMGIVMAFGRITFTGDKVKDDPSLTDEEDANMDYAEGWDDGYDQGSEDGYARAEDDIKSAVIDEALEAKYQEAHKNCSSATGPCSSSCPENGPCCEGGDICHGECAECDKCGKEFCQCPKPETKNE